MSKVLICPDVSQYQDPLDDTFNRDFVIFRVTFGAHRLDPRFLANADAAADLYRQGRIAGALVYTVYTADPVADQFAAVWDAIGPDIPPWLTGIMIDVETWRGKTYELGGDHSTSLNKLFGMHTHRMGSWTSVIAYGNQSDLAELYPRRDRRCRVVVASYSSKLTYHKVPGAIGQQYSDGSTRWSVPRIGGQDLPRNSAPFGHCDHNVFPGCANGRELVQMLRPAQLKHGRHAQPIHRHHPVEVPHPVAPPTKPEPPAPVHRDALISHNGQHALVLRDDGSFAVRKYTGTPSKET